MTWYNKYRPTKFSEVVGQEMVKRVLENSLKYNRLKHAYLLSGPKGVGKTTLARIFASELNQTDVNPEASLDIIELDAASHTGIDDIRLLIESAQTPPMSGKYKIFIIDEVHMLSKSAMNALLKILEEPPSYLIFLLATTNEEKLLPTILSRLTRLKLTAHSETDIVNRLAYIAQQEGMLIDQEALQIIAKRSHGSQRDAINLLETLFGYNLDQYSSHEVYQLLGLLPTQILNNLADNLISPGLISPELINEIETSGVDGQELLSQLLEFVLDASLAGQSDWTKLILALAEVLSWQLPISSLLAALSLVKVKLQTVEPTDNLEAASSPKKKEFSQAYSDLSESPNRQATSEPDQVSQLQEHNAIATDLNAIENIKPDRSDNPKTRLSSQELDRFLANLVRLPDCKPTFKLMVADLSAELVEQNLLLQTSKQTYQVGLQHPEIQTWISDQFFSQFGFRPNKILVQLYKSTKLKQADTQDQSDHTDSQTSVASDSSNQEVIDSSQKKFYKIYGQLPEGIDPKLVDVLPGPILLPHQKPDSNNSHLEGIFEFE